MTPELDKIRAEIVAHYDEADKNVVYFAAMRDRAMAKLEGFDLAIKTAPPEPAPHERHDVQRAVMALFTETLPRWTEDALVEHTGFPLTSVRCVLKQQVRASKLRYIAAIPDPPAPEK